VIRASSRFPRASMVGVVLFSVACLAQGHDESDELLQATKVSANSLPPPWPDADSNDVEIFKSPMTWINDWASIAIFKRCANIPDNAGVIAKDESSCQQLATSNLHDYFQFNPDNKKCATAAYCVDLFAVKNPWKVFQNQAPETFCTCQNGKPSQSPKYCLRPPAYGVVVKSCACCNPGFTLKEGQCEETNLWPCSAEGQVCKVATGKGNGHTQQSCQEKAARLGHRYANFNSENNKCWTGDYCELTQNSDWAVYNNPDVTHQQHTTEAAASFDWKKHSDDFSTVCPQFDESMPERDVFLSVHNYFRCRHGYEKLTWNSKLEKLAFTEADNSAKVGRLTNSGSYEFTPSCAQNLKANGPPQMAVTSWYDAFAKKNKNSFTAMLWKRTTQVGCGSSWNGTQYHSCLYAEEAGNIEGEFKNNVPPSKKWINEKEFCCAEAFDSMTASQCDADCQYSRKVADSRFVLTHPGKVTGAAVVGLVR